tara:strand:+ start:75 stop:794 length:720 start_codon:yes stop_codon:yes gene_type:complete
MNILTVMNEDYSSYGRIFFSSLSKLSDYNKIEKIYVIDTGIEEETKAEFLSSYDRIWFIDSEVSHAKTSHNTEDWREIVATKVKGLASLVEAGESPICMIDIDCFFKENFIDEINFEADINVCKRKNPAVFRYPIMMTHIASFFCVNNNDKGLDFLNMWIEKMLTMDDNHVETPALCELIPKVSDLLTIQHLDQDVVSSNNLTDQSKIVHLKAEGTGYNSTFEHRTKRIASLINPSDYI